MKSRSLATGIAAVIGLCACGGGGGDSAVSGPSPTPEPEPTPTPTPTPTPGPAPSPPAGGADIDMAAPFNQTVSCLYGIKPYYEPAISGDWVAAFNGDVLSLNSFTGGKSFGGSFGKSGNPVERENYPGAALQKTYLGATGGEIYFTKAIDGKIIATGHNKFGGSFPRPDTVECGPGIVDQWTPIPAETPFYLEKAALKWGNGKIEVNCATRAGAGEWSAVVAGMLTTDASGPLTVGIGAIPDAIALTSYDDPDRDEVFIADSGKLSPGGLRIWQSAKKPPATDPKILLNLRYDDLIRGLEEISSDDDTTRCVPRPLDPRY